MSARCATAIEEANALAGPDTINLQANATYLLNLTTGSAEGEAESALAIADSVTINGAGPASTIVDGNGVATGKRVLFVHQCLEDKYDNQSASCTVGTVVVSMSALTIEHGRNETAGPGGGIWNAGSLTIDHSVVTDNRVDYASDSGGGIASSGSLTLTNSVVSNNSTGTHNPRGGGIYSYPGALVIANTTVSDNSTSGSPGTGGGLYVLGTPTVAITHSTFSGNSATVGGGIYKDGSTIALIDDTISGNFSSGNGGGIFNDVGTLGLYNVTVTQNRANSDDAGFGIGGGIYNNSTATLNLTDSIVAGNEVIIPTSPIPTLGSDECAGTLTSLGYNVMTYVDGGHCTILGPQPSADDAGLGPLAFNGGPTQTHALLAGSKAIDAGNPSGCTDDLGGPVADDQRGVARPYGIACDIGAFEYAEIIFDNGFDSVDPVVTDSRH